MWAIFSVVLVADRGTTGNDVKVVVEDANSGEAIYELRTMLFDPPLASALNGSATPKEPRNSRARGRR